MDDNRIDEINNNIPNLNINQTSKMEILQFKNEILSDIKQSQKISENKLENFIEKIETRFGGYENKLNSLSEKLQEINTNKTVDNIINDHVKDLLTFQTETRDKLITIDIKLENLEKDMYNNVYRIDKILTDSVLYPGIIGNMCKFKTFHDFIDYLLTQTSQNITFKDKTEMDLKSFKSKLEKYLKNFTSQLDSVLREANIFTKKCIENVELRMKPLFNEIDEKIKDIKFDNTNSMQEYEKSFKIINKELASINDIKEEIDKNVEEKFTLIKEENIDIINNYINQKDELDLMKEELEQISYLIEDLKSRNNIGKRERKGDLINRDNKEQIIKENINRPINKKLKSESKIKKYIKGELKVNEFRNSNNNNINTSNNNNEEQRSSINYNSYKSHNYQNNTSERNKNNELNSNISNENNQIEKNKSKYEYNSQSQNIEDNYNFNYIENDSKIKDEKEDYKSKSNSKKKEIKIKKENYNIIKNKNFPKTTKMEKVKNSRKELNIKNIKNKQITFDKKPKNRNPKEINKNLKNVKKKYEKRIKKRKIKENKEEYESEESEEESINEEEEEEESINGEEEESSENTEDNLSCDDIDDYSDDEEEEELDEITISKNVKRKRRKTSKISLPKIKSNKRDSSAKISKVKQLSNKNFKSNYKEKEKKVKYLNSKSRNANIKNLDKKENNKEKLKEIKRNELTDDAQQLISVQKYKNDHSNFMKNIEKRYSSEYKNMIKEEDNNSSNNDKEEQDYLNNKYNKRIYEEKNNNIKKNKESSYKSSNSKINNVINIDNKISNIENNYNDENNNINTDLDVKQREIKNLNRNIKNYINKLKSNNISSVNNNSISRYLLYDKYHNNNDFIKEFNNEMNNSNYLNPTHNYNINENTNKKSRNKIMNKNNNDIINNINNNMNIINNMKNNTYLYMPKIYKDFDINSYNNNIQNMTIENGNEFFSFSLNEKINGNRSTNTLIKDKNINKIITKLHKNKSATNIYFTDKIKLQNNRISYKNKNYRNNFSKLKPNFSSEIGNNKSNIGFSSSNNNSFMNNNSNNKEQIKNQYDITNRYHKYEYIKNMKLKNILDKLDNNINFNEKIISSPFQTYQKDIDFKNSHPMNITKKTLFDNNNKSNYKNINNNNYPNNFYNLKAKEAELIQNLVNNLQSNIPEYARNHNNKNK